MAHETGQFPRVGAPRIVPGGGAMRPQRARERHDLMSDAPPLTNEPDELEGLGPSLARIYDHAGTILEGRRAELSRAMAAALRSGDQAAVDAATNAICEEYGGDDE